MTDTDRKTTQSGQGPRRTTMRSKASWPAGRRRGRRVRPRGEALRRAGRAAAWPLGGAEVAGSGPVPHPLGVRGGALCPIAPRDRVLWAAPRSPGQALCPARWVRLRAARWARPRAKPPTRLCKGGRPSRLFYASLVGIWVTRSLKEHQAKRFGGKWRLGQRDRNRSEVERSCLLTQPKLDIE
jgi:hypothetical protein